ncbi:MAG: phage holin family protein [Oligoflexales bacterium]|nr:phage holin family protein [Oligoflexales bacterium]
MIYLLKRLLVLCLVILGISYLFDGIYVSSFGSALAAAALLGIFNVILKPILILLTLPFTIITLGLFLLVINALMLQIVDFFIDGFSIAGFWAAFFGALVISAANWIFNINDSDRRSGRIHFRTSRMNWQGHSSQYAKSDATKTIDLQSEGTDKWR